MLHELVQHDGFWVRPGPDGCLCGQPQENGYVDGGDCRSIGCDPNCPAAGCGEASPDLTEDCPELSRELDRFYSDPMTVAYGVGSEMAPLVVKNHVRRHGCHGEGRMG